MTANADVAEPISTQTVAAETVKATGAAAPPAPAQAPTAIIAAVQEDIVRFRLTNPGEQEMVQNEVVYVLPRRQPGVTI